MSQLLEFPGWDAPSQNWSKLPHAFIDLISRMKESELKVTLYILRHTWGYGNYGDYQFMTTDEIMNGRFMKGGSRIDSGTGLSKNSVISGIRAGIERKTLEEVVIDKDQSRIRKGYRLKAKPEQDPGFKICTSGVQNLNIDHNKDTYKEKEDPQPSADEGEQKPKKDSKPSILAVYNSRMEDKFHELTNLPLPKRITAADRKAAGARWNRPLWEIYDMFRPDEERLNIEVKRVYEEETLDNALALIELAVSRMRNEKLTMDSPASIIKVARSIYANEFVNAATSSDFWEKHL